jgi:hypothetical protein
VVPDDREERDVGVAEVAERGDGSLEVPEAGASVVEEVSGVDDRVDVVVDGVGHHLLERREEVPLALGRVVLAVADVGVARVNHPCHTPALAGIA